MHASLRFAALALAAQCCGSSCGDGEPVIEPPPGGPQVPHLRTQGEAIGVRVRVSKPELIVDCGSTNFSIVVDDAVFGPARELTLGKQPVALYRPEDRPTGAEQRCALIALELPDGPLVARASGGYQEYLIDRDSSGKLTLSGAVGLNVAKRTSPVCTAPRHLSWSETIVTGAVVVQAIEPPNFDGCQSAKLAPAAPNEAASITWSACIGDAKLPFAVGDPVKVAQNDNPTTKVRVLRIERTNGDRLVLWLLRGPAGGLSGGGWDGKLVSLSSSQRSEECRPTLRPGCGTIELGDEVSATIAQRAITLRSGESANVVHPSGTKLELHVVHSVFRPVVDPACSKEIASAPADLGVVVIERGGPPTKPPEIVAPNP